MDLIITHIEIVMGIILTTFLISSLICYLYYNGQLTLVRQKYTAATDQNNILKLELQQERQLLAEEKSESQALGQKIVAIESDLRNMTNRFIQLQDDSEAQDNRFKTIASEILEEKSKSFDVQHRKGLKDILEPLSQKIKHFEDRVEKTNTDTIKRHESLKEQIKSLSAQSEKVSKDASNLANALKADVKKQGNWGEMILESILGKSGLEKDREYHTQVSVTNSEGKKLQPDVVIDLPDNKKLIIDSKVSLRAYDKMVNADTEEEAAQYQKDHAQAIKKHIDTLSVKNYHDLYRIESPDFVLMFIPMDTAFSAALEYDGQLYQYAFDKNIVIVTASTLLATLKTVESLWRNDKQNRFAIEIASEAGKMYDKFVGFVTDMDNMGLQLNKVSRTYNESLKKLSTGSGNLVKRAENIKALGAKANKSLPESHRLIA